MTDVTVGGTVATLPDYLRKQLDPGIPTNDSVNWLLYGPFGTGKTHTVFTGRQPIYMQSFDPNGSSLAHVTKLVSEGRAIVNRECEEEDDSRPSAYDKFARNFNELKKSGAFNHIGTYSIDSLTFLTDAILNKVHANNGLVGKNLRIQDYGEVKAIFKRVIAMCCALPCDFVLTAHVTTEKDEVTLETITSITTVGKNGVIIPTFFEEVYVSEVDRKESKPAYHVLTSPQRRYNARTRIGSGVFTQHETPDLMYLRKKAGRGVEHLPPLR
jgi:predicted dehydrogenase